MKHKMKSNKSEQKKIKNSLKTNETIDKQKENLSSLMVLDDEKLEKKYRKMYISKNLYDSLDDEEVLDEEKINDFYISPNSATVYVILFQACNRPGELSIFLY